MNSEAVTTLLLMSTTTLGLAIVAILTAVLTIGVGMLVFKFGWQSVKASTGTLTPWDMGRSAGYGASDERFNRDWKKFKKQNPDYDKEQFAEEYFDV